MNRLMKRLVVLLLIPAVLLDPAWSGREKGYSYRPASGLFACQALALKPLVPARSRTRDTVSRVAGLIPRLLTPAPESRATMPVVVRVIESIGGRRWAMRYIHRAWWLESFGLALAPAAGLVYLGFVGILPFAPWLWAAGLGVLFMAGHAGRDWLEKNYGVRSTWPEVIVVGLGHALGVGATVKSFQGAQPLLTWLWPLVWLVPLWWVVFSLHRAFWQPVFPIDGLETNLDAIRESLRSQKDFLNDSSLEEAARLVYDLKRYAGGLGYKHALQIEPASMDVINALRHLGMHHLEGLKTHLPEGMNVGQGDILSPPIFQGHGGYQVVFGEGALNSVLIRESKTADAKATSLRFLYEVARFLAPSRGVYVDQVRGPVPFQLADLKSAGFECIDEEAFAQQKVIALRRLPPPRHPRRWGLRDPLKRALARLRVQGLNLRHADQPGVIVRPLFQDYLTELEVLYIGSESGRPGKLKVPTISTNQGRFIADKLLRDEMERQDVPHGKALVEKLVERWLQKALYDPAIGLFPGGPSDTGNDRSLVFVGATDDVQIDHNVHFTADHVEGFYTAGITMPVETKNIKDEGVRNRINRLISGAIAVSDFAVEMSCFKYVLVPEPLVAVVKDYFSDVMLPLVIPVRRNGDRYDFETAIRGILSLERDLETFWWATRFQLPADKPQTPDPPELRRTG